MLDGPHFFECACYSDEHLLKFVYDKKEHEIYAIMFLSAGPWYKRLWVAMKYLCGYKCKYGHWGSWLMRTEDLGRFIALFTGMKEDCEKPSNRD